MKKYLCEFLGTCVLVLFGCGVAVMTEANVVATSLAFGLSIVALAYTIGKISGCHVNPAVSFAMWIDKRISTKDLIFYIIAQVLGAIAGSGLLVLIFNSTTLTLPGIDTLGANAYGSLVTSNITMLGALITEIVLTFVFVLAVLGVTRDEQKSSVAPMVIGLALVLVHLLGIGLTGTSVNPARSLGPAIFAGGEYLEQVIVFIIGPLVGAAFAALAFFFIELEEDGDVPVEYKPVSKVEDEVIVIEEKVEKKPRKNNSKTTKAETKTEKKETTKTTKKTTTTRKPRTNKTKKDETKN